MTDSRLIDLDEVRAGLAAGLLFLLTPVGERLQVGVDPALAVVVVVTMAVALAGRWAVLVVAAGWGLVTGFVVNTSGVLTFGVHDLARLGVVAGAAAAAAALRPLVRRVLVVAAGSSPWVIRAPSACIARRRSEALLVRPASDGNAARCVLGVRSTRRTSGGDH